ncbi:unnamed protein product [Orchesella dallaii]|uniref:Uncharacterized protein n=1 Tax=Orchesella dallaii TaxID=48710 RepID=A0ABP1R9Z5_9HEXA
MDKILGSELPVLEKEGRIYWNTIWWARRAESGLVGEPGVRSILDFLDPQTGNLEILFHLEFWRARSEIARLNPPMLVFDALRLANLPLELQTPPDVCLVTNGGIIKAHSIKLYHEFPGLLSDVGNAPLMSGYAWFEHNFDFTTVLKIVLVMYDVYYPGFNNDIITLLLFASRLKMRQLYVKLLRGQPNHQPQHQ